jgi:Zinc knuckle
MVIVGSLDDHKALSQMDKHDYFWRGIKPPSFREEIGSVLRHSKLWIDLTCPPPMQEVIRTIKLRLKQDLYRVLDDDEQDGLHDNDALTESSDSDSSSKVDSDTDNDTRPHGFKRHHIKPEAKPTKDEPTIHALEPKPQDPGNLVKSNMDDLAEKIGCLTIALGCLQADTAGSRPVNLSTSSIICFMCGEQGHLLKDCPETKAFVTKKVLRWSSEGQLVQADGLDLPRGDIGNGGVTCILQDQLANSSNVEMEHLRSFNLMNQEFAMFREYDYEVFPADNEQRCGQKRSHPNNKEESRQRGQNVQIACISSCLNILLANMNRRALEINLPLF